MRGLLIIAFMALTAAPANHTYLISIEGVPLKDTENLKAFSFETWGVRVKSVCHIPPGWFIKAGSSATPDGVLAGEGSQGTTWFSSGSPRELRSLALVEISGSVRWNDERSGSGIVPATLRGFATLETDDGDRKIALERRNIVLRPADRCVDHAK